MRGAGPRMVVVGGGILGTMHAVMARRAGWEVRHLERDLEPRGATVRNFGLVWVSGRAPGPELAAALRARHLWEELATSAPGVGFRPDGSLTVVTTEAEHAVLEAVCERSDADARGFELPDPAAARRHNPLVLGALRAALWCAADAVVEPRQVLPALPAHMLGDGDYRWLPGSTVVAIDRGRVVDQHGVVHGADMVVVCPGSVADGPVAALAADAPLRRVQLQMMETAPLGHRLPTSVADGDSLRYYPAFDVPARADLEPLHDLAAAFDLQLLVSQRSSGALTIEDTHRRDEPFDFALDDRPYDELTRRVEAIMGTAMPPITRRWSGVYSQHTDGGLCHRDEPIPVWLVTGPGGRGMTLSPAIAEATLTEVGATAGDERGRPMISAVALDMAGTTVHDGGVVEAAFVDAFRELGRTPTNADLDHVRSTMGQSKVEVFTTLLGDDAAAREAASAFEAAYERRVSREGVVPIPGVEELFAELRRRNIGICLTTGFSDVTRTMLVERLGWATAIDLSLSPGDGVRGRPYPDLVLTACVRLGVDDVRDMAVAGDTASDLVAGTRAGASVVAGVLTGAHDRAALEAAPHTHILATVGELVDHLR